MPKDAAKDLLLEVGVEELPARFIAPALEALKAQAEKALKEAGLSFKSVQPLGTPRRLAILVHHLSPKAEDRVHESFGPGLAQAKDAQGNWTPAAQGFARSQGTTPEALEVRQTEKGPRLAFVRKEEGLPAEKALPALLPELIKKIPFPKNMVWEESRFSFARPVRWIVALHGTQVVRFSLAGVKSGNKTFGLRIHGKKPVPVPAPAKYAQLLKDRLVAADPAVRRDLVERQVQQAVKPVKGLVALEAHAALLDEVTNLVEHPVGLLGSFDEKYLELPAEVLVTSMKKHQKYFPVLGEGGKLMPHFVGVRNGISENQTVVREGYERVLSARLSDAAFFYKQDLQTSLESKTTQLKGVLFQKELGSVWEKVERVKALVSILGGPDFVGVDDEVRRQAGEIAALSKSDLVTSMVGEFPELQGVMGRIYAQQERKDQSIARGLEEYYWPLNAEGQLPTSPAAALVSLADRLDTLTGDFLVGLIPTGSQDPYGLRRAAVGVLRILETMGWSMNLRSAVKESLGLFSEAIRNGKGGDKVIGVLVDFLRQRWAALVETQGFRADEISAVTATTVNIDFNPIDIRKRLQALHEIRPHKDFEPLAAAFKRAANILRQARQKAISFPQKPAVEVLNESAEKGLFDALAAVSYDGGYKGALHSLVSLREPVDAFFSGVMVMAPEENVRANRLALLNDVVSRFLSIADLSQLQDTPVSK